MADDIQPDATAAADRTAARRVCETREILSANLDQLDTKDIAKVCGVSETFLRTGCDLLGQRKSLDIEQVKTIASKRDEQAGGKSTIFEAQLASVRTITCDMVINCSRPSAQNQGRFSPTDLRKLQSLCPNLRHIRCDRTQSKRPSLIKAWKIDLIANVIDIAEVNDVERKVSLDRAYLKRDVARTWAGYTVRRSIKLVLNYQSQSGLSSRNSALNSVTAEVKAMRAVVFQFSSARKTATIEAAIDLLNNRGAFGNDLDEVLLDDMHEVLSTDELQLLLDVCAGTCLRLVLVRCSSPIPLPLASLNPPPGTTLHFDDGAKLSDPCFALRALPSRYLTNLDLVGGRRESLPGFDLFGTIAELVRSQLPALKRLSFAVTTGTRGHDYWPIPNYSWPGSVETVDVSLCIISYFACIWRAWGLLPYFKMATTLACLCSDGDALTITQCPGSCDRPQSPESYNGMGQREMRDVIDWLQSLNPKQQQEMRELDYTVYSLRPLRQEPYTWRHIAFDDNDKIMPLQHCVTVDRVRQLRAAARADDEDGTRAKWALERILAAE